jgi:hypothetical protein
MSALLFLKVLELLGPLLLLFHFRRLPLLFLPLSNWHSLGRE